LSSDDDPKCDSRDFWWPTITSVAQRFEAALNEESLNDKRNKQPLLVSLMESNLQEAFQMYEKSWRRFKEHTYGSVTKEERIDRHKVISLYVLSFLTKRPFLLLNHRGQEDKNANNMPFFLANELFSLEIVYELLSAWSDNDERFSMDEEEKKWLLILFNHFKLRLTKLNPPFVSEISEHTVSSIDLLSLSQIIYHIEKSYNSA